MLSVKSKTSKKKKTTLDEVKFGTALVPFKRIGDAFAAVCASGVKERGLEGIEIVWAANSREEPELITWLKNNGKLGVSSQGVKDQEPQTPNLTPVSLPSWLSLFIF